MTAQQAFEKMMNGKQVRLTAEGRKELPFADKGWFSISWVSPDYVEIISQYHQILTAVSLEHIV